MSLERVKKLQMFIVLLPESVREWKSAAFYQFSLWEPGKLFGVCSSFVANQSQAMMI